GVLVIEVIDLRPVAWRIGGNIVFEWDGNIDDATRHDFLLLLPRAIIISGKWHGTRRRKCPLIGLRVRRSTIRSSTRNTPIRSRAFSPSSAARCWRGV